MIQVKETVAGVPFAKAPLPVKSSVVIAVTFTVRRFGTAITSTAEPSGNVTTSSRVIKNVPQGTFMKMTSKTPLLQLSVPF